MRKREHDEQCKQTFINKQLLRVRYWDGRCEEMNDDRASESNDIYIYKDREMEREQTRQRECVTS